VYYGGFIGGAITASCAFSIFLGTVMAVYERDLKQLIAYSAISNFGIIALGLCGDEALGAATLLYMYIYIFNLVYLFAILMSMHYSLGPLEGVIDVVKLRFTSHYGIIVMVCLFSLAGLPPLPGFFAKYLIIVELINQEFIAFAVFILVSNIVTFAYYIRLLRLAYVSTDKLDLVVRGAANKPLAHFTLFIIIVLALILILSIWWYIEAFLILK